ncbi:MAG TPA: hypothetical protein VGP46_11155, partial [Acidimicrobiales bacterium]|nr:hypothetical protein [Acidimicrobiales bacterium]
MAATFCMAAGLSGELPLAARWNGHSWLPVGAPIPPGVSQGYLQGIVCPSTAVCVAVGNDGNSTGATGAFGDVWRGHGFVASGLAPEQGSVRPVVSAVSCVSTSSCMAVGSDTRSTSGGTAPLAELWDGRSWRVLAVPSAGGPSALASLVCRQGLGCIAVGYELSASTGLYEIEEFLWTGKNWHVSGMPSPPSVAGEAVLPGLACPTTHFCAAIGYYASADSSQILSFSETWDGRRWTIHDAASEGTVATELDAVHCTSPRYCVAVGGFYRRLGGGVLPEAVSEVWNGRAWTVVDVPNAAGANVSYLFAVKCPAPTSCESVGEHDGSGGSVFVTAAYDWQGTSWRVQPSPAPEESVFSQVLSVSCIGSGRCVIVGTYLSGEGFFPFGGGWSGGGWSLGNAAWPGDYFGNGLESVSCVAKDWCLAVGTTESLRLRVSPLVELWNGHTWTLAKSLALGAGRAGLDSISCSSSKMCAAVGAASSHAGTKGLAEVWNGHSWRLTKV